MSLSSLAEEEVRNTLDNDEEARFLGRLATHFNLKSPEDVVNFALQMAEEIAQAEENGEEAVFVKRDTKDVTRKLFSRR